MMAARVSAFAWRYIMVASGTTACGFVSHAVVVAGCFMVRTPRKAASIVEAARTAPRLDVAAAFLALEPALFRRMRRLGRSPRGRPHHGLAQQFDEAIGRICAVALLGAE